MSSLRRFLRVVCSLARDAKRSPRRLPSRTSGTAAFVETCESRELLSNFSLGTLASGNSTTERSGRITPTNTMDTYDFRVATATQVRVTIHGMTDNVDVQLRGLKDILLLSSSHPGVSTDSFVTATLRPDITYIVNVLQGSEEVNSDYFVEISTHSINNTSLGTLSSANATNVGSGRITPADPIDNYTFNLATATKVRVAIHGMTDNVGVRLIGPAPDFAVLGSSTLPGTSIDGFVTATIVANKTYTVQVFAESVVVDAKYFFEISSVATSDDVITSAIPMTTSGLLSYGQQANRSGTLGTGADLRDYYSFTLPLPTATPEEPLPEPVFYNISANLKGKGSTKKIELLDESGEVLLSRAAPLSDTLLGTYLASGTYYLRVSASELTSRSYDLSVSVGPEDELDSHILDGDNRTKRFTGVVNQLSTLNRIHFKLTNPTSVRAVLSGMTSNLKIEIRKASGLLVASSNRAATLPEIPVTSLLPAGEYSVDIRGPVGSSYTLELTVDVDSDNTLVGVIDGGTLSNTRPTYEFSAPLVAQNLQDYHKFTLQSVRDVRIRLSDFDRDLDVELMNADGVLLQSGQASGLSTENFINAGLPAGTYFVRVFRKALLRNLNTEYQLVITQKLGVAPSGIDGRSIMFEGTTRILALENFSFTDSGTQGDSLLNVKITTLPAKGSLTVNTTAGEIPVTAGQIIPAAAITGRALKYRPALNEFGIGYASFNFQVQDNGAVYAGDADLDLTSNVLTIDVVRQASTSVTMPAVAEDSTSHNGMLVSQIVSAVTGIAPGALRGIAVTDAPATIGTWQYALDGTNWQNVTGVSLNSELLLAANSTTRVRFLPNPNAIGSAGLRFRAWDQTSGTPGTIANVLLLTPAALSATAPRLNVNITPVNDAPVMTITSPELPLIDEDQVFAPGPNSGAPISTLLGGATDVDANAKKGIAVYEASTARGRWQYSLTNGENWEYFGAVSLSSARLLRDFAHVRVRFLPNANSITVGQLRFYAWDQTQGVNGGTFDLSGLNTKGGTTAFSGAAETATQTVRPINDAPTITLPAPQNTPNHTPLVFSTLNGNRLILQDIDAVASSSLRLTVSVTNGTFTLPTTNDLIFSSGGNGQSMFTVTGSLNVLNFVLEGAKYTPNSRTFGNNTLTLTLNDQGNSGFGNSLESTKSLDINVALPSNTIDMGTLTAAVPTTRRSGNRDGATETPDFYTFRIDTASDVRLNLSGLSNDLDVRVTNSAGMFINQGVLSLNAIENVPLNSLAAGTYLVSVFNQLVSAYDLTITTASVTDDLISDAVTLSAPTAATLPTVRQQGVSSSADLQDYYKFNLTTASALRLNLTGLSQDMGIELLDSVGRSIQSADLSGNVMENMLTSTLAAGLYHVRVFSTTGQLTSNYDLTMSTATTSDDLLTNATNMGLLDSKGSDRRTGNVATGTDMQDYYRLVVGVPADLSISVSGFSSDVDLQLLDNLGRVVASSTAGGTTAESINVPSAVGTYYLRIFPFSGSSNYVLEARANSNAQNADDLLSTATVLPNPSATVTTRTGTIGGTGSTGDPQDYYRFQLTSTRNVTITLSGLSQDIDVQLLDQFGNIIASSANGGVSNETINMPTLGLGIYLIRIFPFTSSPLSSYSLGVTAV